ncbi:MAG: tRNA (5-methylaminomethyl-2-thiouridine)(34)-methyltransferase MnmD [Bacteroidetes bacterium]|nr:tRNA (5-methylaminomethyl-2-thiouridine)(34)-methyltransferase MnmD [Bacteroidota bacterium]
MDALGYYRILTTDDGSHTLFNEHIGESYHSTFGAIQESAHIFIQGALDGFRDKQSHISILEIGFGTGLNALLTLLWAEKLDQQIQYHGLEAFPISEELAGSLNYHKILKIDQQLFLKFHQPFYQPYSIKGRFTLEKEIIMLEKAVFTIEKYDVVYFDAFSPEVQPGLWTKDIFSKLFKSLKKGGVMTTYSCKGIVKRALKESGFRIEKLPGPPGKREFLRAFRDDTG